MRRHRRSSSLLLVTAAGTPAHAESTRGKQWFLDAMKAEQRWQTGTALFSYSYGERTGSSA
ncbi:hypothetical protein [Streptomyces prasinus]|uniref:hypothetical protein n=1 Tax=Streptomyces prasinus TaxID=67345 RepID=UPI0033E7698E